MRVVAEEGRAVDSRSLDPLIERCQAGDREALGQLYERHRNEVFRTLRYLLRSQDEVEDVLQEVFIAAFRSVPRFRGDAKFSTWLYRITVNVALQHLRRKKGVPIPSAAPLEEKVEGRPQDPSLQVERRERSQAAERILEKLSPKKRAVFVMHDIMGKSTKEIAEIMGSPALTIRTRLHYARKEFFARAAKEPCFDGEL
jgi:RNA polymerase sigma-70 factor (ECF subfamily)